MRKTPDLAALTPPSARIAMHTSVDKTRKTKSIVRNDDNADVGSTNALGLRPIVSR